MTDWVSRFPELAKYANPYLVEYIPRAVVPVSLYGFRLATESVVAASNLGGNEYDKIGIWVLKETGLRFVLDSTVVEDAYLAFYVNEIDGDKGGNVRPLEEMLPGPEERDAATKKIVQLFGHPQQQPGFYVLAEATIYDDRELEKVDMKDLDPNSDDEQGKLVGAADDSDWQMPSKEEFKESLSFLALGDEELDNGFEIIREMQGRTVKDDAPRTSSASKTPTPGNAVPVKRAGRASSTPKITTPTRETGGREISPQTARKRSAGEAPEQANKRQKRS